jgi:hypothetical protein
MKPALTSSTTTSAVGSLPRPERDRAPLATAKRRIRARNCRTGRVPLGEHDSLAPLLDTLTAS